MKKFLIFTLVMIAQLQAAKDHEIWWEKSIDTGRVSLNEFRDWLGDTDDASRVAMRRHVAKMGYSSLLDAAAGVCTDYWGLKKNGFMIDYLGVDITPKLVAFNKKMNVPIVEGSIEALPASDKSFDICYARHILEHLDSYERALRELIRVAKKEVLVVFFLRPSQNKTTQVSPSVDNGYLLYNNIYSEPEIEAFAKAQPRVLRVQWEEVNARDSILHIYLR